LLKALQGFAAETLHVIALVPRCGRVIAVDGDRVHVNARKESGLGLRMVLNLYRSGEVTEKRATRWVRRSPTWKSGVSWEPLAPLTPCVKVARCKCQT